MRAYLLTTGSAFALLTAVHIWRIAVEGTHLLGDPMVILTTILGATLAAWAFVLLRRLRPDSRGV